jgi:2-haloacid dehalogenase
MNRRGFLKLAAGSVGSTLFGQSLTPQADASSKIKLVAFDTFTTFDPRPVFALEEKLFPGKGVELSNA